MQERGTAPALTDPSESDPSEPSGIPARADAVSRSRPVGTGERGAKRSHKRFLVAVAVACVVVAVDQLTKSWAVSRLSHGSIHVFWKLDLVLEYNSGSSFSFFQGWAPVIGAVAVVIVCVLLVMARNARSVAVAVFLGMVIGGALGNLADRVFRSHHGSVVDFIAFHFWPTFNFADACVTVGGILLVVSSIGSPPSKRHAVTADGDDTERTDETDAAESDV